MMFKTNLIAGILALALFGYGQHQGWNLFEKEASAQTARSGTGHGNGGRISHK